MRRGLLLLAVLAAGCGGGGGGDEGGGTALPPATTQTPTEIQTVTVPETADPAAKPSGRPRFEARLTAQGHSAVAGTPWRYTVVATKGGRPAGGTAKMRVFLGDELVDTLGWFPFEGTLTKTHQWPRSLRGKKVVLQAEVEGEGGTQRANWPVTIS